MGNGLAKVRTSVDGGIARGRGSGGKWNSDRGGSLNLKDGADMLSERATKDWQKQKVEESREKFKRRWRSGVFEASI
jgi:hypothetical protein